MRNSRIHRVLILFGLSLMLCGCASSSSTYVSPETVVRKQIEIILQAVIDRDEKAIEELFCPYVREHDEQLQEEIIGMFDFIDGDIVSYDEPEIYRNGGTMTPLDGYVERSFGFDVTNIYTSTGKVYSLGHDVYLVFKEKSDYVGVYDITVFDKTPYDSEDDCSEETEYWIFLPEMFE